MRGQSVVAKKKIKNPVGAPTIWGEAKRSFNLTLSPTAITGLTKLANQRGLSCSELVERVGREMLLLSEPEAERQQVNPDLDLS